ncbi:hypothetical protein RhiirA5_434671 [Rhizophagus irregularis]|uniref:Uncharacterized protein n=1 Tax=Rhizophagus irregularis TaxID=588596 RepID=A0A2N0NPM5_9GLOM|nr:hypothetical protein RhiirA5_434671 [Rhizophagus irregularis]
MTPSIRKKFSKKFIKNLEKSYRSVSNEEDIYNTYSSSNKNGNRNNKMSTEQPQTPQNTQLTTESTAPMEEIINTSSTHILSNSESDISSHDQRDTTVHSQTPITTSTDKSTYMEEDPKETNPDKEKSADQQINTQQDLPNSINIITLNDLFEK